MLKINKKKGFLFWITGFSGSGKSSLGKIFKKEVEKDFGKTIIIHGDDLRNILKLNKYDKKSRLENGKKYCKLLKLITDQNVNVIITVVGMFHSLRNWNRNNINNYVEIYIKSKIKMIKDKTSKKTYIKFNKDIVGQDIKPELPKNPDIIITNDFKITSKDLSKILLKKFKKKYEKNYKEFIK